jgi:hypothetical protein
MEIRTMTSLFNRTALGSALATVALGTALLTGPSHAAETGVEHEAGQCQMGEAHAAVASDGPGAGSHDGSEHADHEHAGKDHEGHDHAGASAAPSLFDFLRSSPFGFARAGASHSGAEHDHAAHAHAEEEHEGRHHAADSHEDHDTPLPNRRFGG